MALQDDDKFIFTPWSRRRRVWVRDWHRYHLNKRVDDSRRFSSTQTAGDNRSSNSTANCAVLKLPAFEKRHIYGVQEWRHSTPEPVELPELAGQLSIFIQSYCKLCKLYPCFVRDLNPIIPTDEGGPLESGFKNASPAFHSNLEYDGTRLASCFSSLPHPVQRSTRDEPTAATVRTVKLTELSFVALFDLSLLVLKENDCSDSVLVVFHYFPVSVADRISTTTTGNRSNRLQDVPCHRRVKDAFRLFYAPTTKGLGFSGTLLTARTSDLFLAKQKQGHQDKLALMEWMSLSENV
ncbi:hypothetical protein T4B_5971 [Trichinella pseudospiralis]|uniref:Uncharacterized protein n=1 Tax=Trichinella pseudospiralis TaxID=6337 RepID=A0A0V1IUW6_TRIPS|nr:hypothetical protein T4B_5971 [Trichinella pseudospiralis]